MLTKKSAYKLGAFYMPENRENLCDLAQIPTGYKRTDTADTVDIIGDGLKTEVRIMAETTPTPTQTPEPTSTPNYDEIFSKLDAILDKRSDGLAKSALKDNGVDENEIADIVKAYREQKQAKATEQANALTTANQTIADLQKQISERDVNDAFSAAAIELGLDATASQYVSRLADKSGVLSADGKPDVEKVKEAINKVLEDVPALKASANTNKGFQPVGAKAGDGAGSGEDADKKLRSYFGLK